MSTTTPFLSDIQEIRRRARENMMRGPVTDDYKGDVRQSIDILNQALATEIVCVLRYKRHFYSAKGLHKESVADEFLQHANEEQIDQREEQQFEDVQQRIGQPSSVS